MPLYQAVVLALVQSLTEFLPVSSTAHLTLAPWLLGWRDPGLTYDIALHLGTLAGLIAYFFRDWLQLAAQGFGLRWWNRDAELGRNPRLLWWLAAATLPAALFGYFFQEQAETAWRSPFVIGGMLIGIGLLMYVADRLSQAGRDVGGISLADSILIGLAQAVAIIPGTSRSGITISVGLFRNLNRAAAARFSFLLSTPALAGASLKAWLDVRAAGGIQPGMETAFLVGVAVSAVTSWLVIAFFLRFLRTHTLQFFVYYRVIFGIIVIALALTVRR
ncbi:MAG: undecaprenyl-diphosphate phosphatase [Acidobacteriota bacterium]